MGGSCRSRNATCWVTLQRKHSEQCVAPHGLHQPPDRLRCQTPLQPENSVI